MEMLSPGVYITETDNSTVASAASSSVGVFGGHFTKGPVEAYSVINTVEELISNYGKPTSENFNDWYQVYNYLSYASQCYVARAANTTGRYTELPATTIKRVGKEVEEIPGVKASNDFAEAVDDGIQGNNIIITVDDGEPLITVKPVAASCKYATAQTVGEDGNNLKIKITKTGVEETQPAVAATSDIATAKTPGADGNKIRVDILQVADTETVKEVKADSDIATAKLPGIQGNDLKIRVTGKQANWTIQILHKNQVVQTLQSISDDTEPDLLDSSYVTFKAHIKLSVREYQLTGGVDQVLVNTFTVQTFQESEKRDEQENITKPSDVKDNDLVTFHINTLTSTSVALTGGSDKVTKDVFSVETLYKEVAKDKQSAITAMSELSDNVYVVFNDKAEITAEEVALTNGVNEESEPTYVFRTYDQTRPYEVVEQRGVQEVSDLKDNFLVNFDRMSEWTIQTGDYPLEGGEDGFEGGLDYSKLQVSSLASLTIGDIVKVDDDTNDIYKITDVDTSELYITLDRPLDSGNLPKLDTYLYGVEISMNGACEAVDETATTFTNYLDADGGMGSLMVPNDVSANELFGSAQSEIINNSAAFDEKKPSIAFTSPNSRIKFISRNPGTWCKNIQICVARADAFELNDTTGNHVPHYAFPGLLVDDFFEYAPKDDQIAILIYDGEQDAVVETYLASLDPAAKDSSNRSMFIETLINESSSYVFCKVNSASDDNVADYTLRFSYDSLGNETYVGKTLRFANYSDSDINQADIATAYELFANKEEIDIDNIIANERDLGVSAHNLVNTRQDCICFIGANYSDCVNKKSADAVNNLVKWRKSGALNYNSMFVCAVGSYIQIYDAYSNQNRWVNVAGAVAGLRAQTSKNYESWYASAGLERGQLKNIVKLAFNPTEAQRDTLYKHALNPVCTFPGLGTCLWGQKTLLDKNSSFSRVNVRALFNAMERALAKMARTKIMEFNDSYTRNSIVSVIKPYLATVQAGRGIQAYLVVCDETNNGSQVIANNQLVVDIYVQPTYVAEFIRLNFVNNGANSISTESIA